MFIVKKTMEVSVAHRLDLPYSSKCNFLHGHNTKITVFCSASDESVKNNNGMVIDFVEIKKRIHNVLDHSCLTEVKCPECKKILTEGKLDGERATAENIAKWVCRQIPSCFKVEVEESEGNIAVYVDNDLVPNTVGE